MSPELQEELERFFANCMIAVEKFPVTTREELIQGVIFGFGRSIALADGPEAVEKYAALLLAGGKLADAFKRFN